MRFISVKTVEGKRLEADVPFDTTYVSELSFDRGGEAHIVLFRYDLSDFFVELPVCVNTGAFFCVTLARDDLYISSILDTEDNTDEDYENGFGGIEFRVKMSQEEKRKLLLYILRETK